MKILKARNGIALVAVLTILLITSLFIPVMFNLSDSSLAIAVKGTDRQRVSYFARTVTEMSIAAFIKFDSIEDSQLTPEQQDVRDAIDDLINIDTNADGIVDAAEQAANKAKSIPVSQVEMFLKTDENGTIYYKTIDGIKTQISKADYNYLSILNESKPQNEKTELTTGTGKVETLYYATNDTQNPDPNYAIYTSKPDIYKHIGTANCTITYQGGPAYFKKKLSTGEVTEIQKNEYDSLRDAYLQAISSGNVDGLDYEVSSVNNNNVLFTTEATVNGAKATRSAILVLQTYPTEDNWFRFKPESGGNQIFVDPDKATSTVYIDYRRSIGKEVGEYEPQPLLVYSSVGNMIIANGGVLKPGVNPGTATPDDYYTSGNDNAQFVLGVEPGLNTTPNNDPSFKIIDGVNYDANLDEAQDNNFVAFASTKAIRVELPINILVNPCRARRLGDGPEDNGSLFKIMLFQAPDILFEGSVDMMMSFYVRGNEEARRMSSVVLNAPSNTPYSYVHEKYGPVKAGRVFFSEDCYLWVIPYGDDGSSSSWTGALSQTVYKRDSDFQKIKIANAGDVYYFNAEIAKEYTATQMVDVTNPDGSIVTDENGNPKKEEVVVKDENNNEVKVEDLIGFSLTGYALETIYLPEYQNLNKGKWWEIWQNAQADIFGAYMGSKLDKDTTYHKDDFHYIGNMNDGYSLIEYPAVDDYYVIWNS